MSSGSIDPRLASVLSLMTEAASLIDSGRVKEGLGQLQDAQQQLAAYMELDLELWDEQCEFLP